MYLSDWTKRIRVTVNIDGDTAAVENVVSSELLDEGNPEALKMALDHMIPQLIQSLFNQMIQSDPRIASRKDAWYPRPTGHDFTDQWSEAIPADEFRRLYYGEEVGKIQ
jgi:hypothetical protein